MVTPYFYPKVGGLENYAYNFCLGLKNKYKWNVVIITSNHKTKKNTVETLNRLKIYRLARWFKLSNTPINPRWFWKIKEIIKDEKPNIINAHTPVPFIADIAALAAKEIPLIVTYHAFSIYKNNFTPLNLLITVYKSFEKLLFKKANKIIIVSDVIKNAIPSEFKNKISVIYNSISSKEILKSKKKNINKSINIIFISSLDKSHNWKGLNEILFSIKLYVDKNKNSNINLSIIGDGNNKQKYKQIVNDFRLTKNVKFLGKKEGESKNKILRDSSLAIIYPKSSNDAFPTVALEYWANQLPIIASNIEPINKLFKNNQTAYLVKPNNPKALAKAIEHVANNRLLSETISSNGHKELLKKYILENEIKKFHLLSKGLAI
ncbi:glycosyltransferase family 4 protein [Candidatus Roizmanbacteria bacterium]|nr:glycosyltransferase family 4 protein [Candidatus Roizmanbacteria bacterium]